MPFKYDSSSVKNPAPCSVCGLVLVDGDEAALLVQQAWQDDESDPSGNGGDYFCNMLYVHAACVDASGFGGE